VQLPNTLLIASQELTRVAPSSSAGVQRSLTERVPLESLTTEREHVVEAGLQTAQVRTLVLRLLRRYIQQALESLSLPIDTATSDNRTSHAAAM
jgi:hypothetical protein